MLLISEGPLDVGDPDRAYAHDGEPRRGAVRVLVQRVLENEWGRDIDEWEIESAHLPRVHGLSPQVTGFERKVELAIVEASARDCSCAVIVVDQDGPQNADRINYLRAGRRRAQARGNAVAEHAAVGVAVHMVETWLLADELAINQALGPAPPAATRSQLEELYGAKGSARYPKGLFRQAVSSAVTAVDAPYDAVAFRIRLGVLEQRCPGGFGALAQEIRARCR